MNLNELKKEFKKQEKILNRYTIEKCKETPIEEIMADFRRFEKLGDEIEKIEYDNRYHEYIQINWGVNKSKGVLDDSGKYINYDRVRDIDISYTGLIAVPITVIDTPLMQLYDIIDMQRIKVDGKAKYARYILKRKEE